MMNNQKICIHITDFERVCANGHLFCIGCHPYCPACIPQFIVPRAEAMWFDDELNEAVINQRMTATEKNRGWYY